MGGERCKGAAIIALIKSSNKSISWLCNATFPITLSPEDTLFIEGKKCVGYVIGNFLKGVG